MKIGIDCQYLNREAPAGPEKYLESLIRALASVDKQNSYTLYFKNEPSEDFRRQLIGDNSFFTLKTLDAGVSWTQIALAKELKRAPVDVYFSSSHTLPFIRTCKLLRGPKIRWVSMVHGLDYLYDLSSFLGRLQVEVPLRIAVKRSDLILVPSPHTKENLMDRGWVSKESEVLVVPEGVSSVFRPRLKEEILPTLQKHDLDDVPYFLFVSTIQPRKNVPGLVEGFFLALKNGKIPQNARLVLCGKRGWDFTESVEAPARFGVSPNVDFLGRVPDEDLPPLFSGASAYVSTSFEEGFGLPLLEAMASGVPCVVSDIPSYRTLLEAPEAVENIDSEPLPAILVDPESAFSIAEGLELALTSYPENYTSFAKTIADQYSWENTARKTLAALEGLYKGS
jgi:glycosyltransferase involved in cell wall biosynthesis